MTLAIITGVAGFIGSHLAERLLAEGWDVVGIDNMLDYYPRTVKEANLQNLRAHPRFVWHEIDVRTFPWDQWVHSDAVIFHLAAQAGVRRSWGREFRYYLEHNVEATQTMLERLKGQLFRCFVFASTSSVYGRCPALPFREDARPEPISPYGVTKLTCEHLVHLYGRQFDVPYVILRYFTVYGPRQRPDMAFYRFMLAATEGRPLTVYDDGYQTRDFTYIRDAVEATYRASLVGQRGEVYNIGGGSRVTLRQALEVLERVIGRPLSIEWKPRTPGDMRHTWADIQKARDQLSYHPTVTLEEGLREQWNWFREARR